VELVLGQEKLAASGGSETYLITVAEQLERLGHQVTIHSPQQGDMADRARARGLRIEAQLPSLPAACDAVIAQDGPTLYGLAARYPEAPRLFVAHSSEFLLQSPPALDGSVGALVVLNDRLADRLGAHAIDSRRLRLRQPVDMERFGRLAPPGETLRRLLVFGHDQGGSRYRALTEVCARRGIEVALAGRRGEPAGEPEAVLSRYDAVVATGRCAVEAMAARRPTYVMGPAGCDGWLTARSYSELEADGFSGRAGAAPFSAARFEADLDGWSPGLGIAAGDLAYRHHDAAAHAAALVESVRALGPAERPGASEAEELARLTRVVAQLEARALSFSGEAMVRGVEAQRLHDELIQVRAELAALKGTRRFRALTLVMRPLDAVRLKARASRAGTARNPD